jgi:RNA polymerase sigma factor (sigma-70 family)
MATRAEQLLRHLRRLASRPASGPEADAALLGRFARGHDEDAFAALVARHGALVLGVCRRVLRDPAAAEDAFQAVWLVLARKAAAVRPPERLAAWLHRVARHVALKALRADARRRQREARALLASALPPPRDPLDELSARELLLVLDEEVQRLPEAYRLPVLLCCLEGRSQEEAARLLGWTAGSVKGRLERGRQRLRARLVRRGLELSAVLAVVDVSRAAVPALLAGVAVRAGLACVTGQGAVGAGASARVVALAEGGLKGLATTKAKLGLVLLLAVGVAAAGTGMLAHREPAAKPPEARPEAGPAIRDAGRERPEEQRGVRLDRYGDPLPAGAIARMGTQRFRLGNFLHALGLSPDGKVLAAAGGYDLVFLWDADTGKELHRLVAHERPGQVYAVAFSSDGKILATGGDHGIRLWETATGRQVRQLEGQLERGLAFSPDGKVLASGHGTGEVCLWDVASGQRQGQLQGHQKDKDRPLTGVKCVAFSPDGKLLASGACDRTILLWDPATGKQLRQLCGHNGCINAVAFSPDGTYLASAGEDRSLRLWEVPSGKPLRQFLGHQEFVTSVAFRPDGKLLASGSGNLVEGGAKEKRALRLWDVATGKEVGALGDFTNGVTAIAFSPGGDTLFSAGGMSIRRWEMATGKEVQPLTGHHGWVATVAFAPDGTTLATGGGDCTIRLWEAATGKEVRQLSGCERAVDCLSFSPDGKTLASGSRDGGVRLWEAGGGKPPRRIGSHTREVAVAFSPDGKTLASGSRDGTLVLRDVATGKELRQYAGSVEGIHCLAFSPDGALLASTGFVDPRKGIGRAAIPIRLWQVATGREVRRLEGHLGVLVGSIAFSPGGKLLASASWDNTVRLWDTASGKEVYQFIGNQGWEGVAFSPDGKTQAAGEGQTIRLWEVATYKERGRFRGHHGIIECIAFSPDGRSLASGSMDSTTLLWDLTGQAGGRRLQAAQLRPEDLESLWEDLAGVDASQAYRAVWRMAFSPEETVPFLKERLRPVRPVQAVRIRDLIGDLGDDTFAVREKATGELAWLEHMAETQLRQALEGRPSLEVRRRVEHLLRQLALPITSPEQLRQLRAVEVLEHAGARDSRSVLERVAAGAPEARLTREAKASLQRLARRPAASP